LPTGTAAEPQSPKPQPEQRVAPKRDAVRDLRQDSPSKKLLQGELTYLRRDRKRREHNQDRLGSHLSNLAGTHSEFLRAEFWLSRILMRKTTESFVFNPAYTSRTISHVCDRLQQKRLATWAHAAARGTHNPIFPPR